MNWFNNQGLRYAVSNAFGQVSKRFFDVEDRTTNWVDANGVVITNVFDNLDRVVIRGYPDGGVERFGYTNIGLVAYTNQLNFVTRYGYDQARRKTVEVNANNETNLFGYSPAGDLLTLTDGKGQITTWNYDRYGRVTNKLDNLGSSMFRYAYDANNRLSSRQTPEKDVTSYTYDNLGNLTHITYPTNSPITFTYDPLNRLTNMVDGVGITAYRFDAVGQLLSENGPWTDDTVSYSYNNRLRTGLTLSAPNDSPWVQSYAYDGARRLTNITSRAGAFGYAYHASRHLLPETIGLPNEAVNAFTYDSVARVTETRMRSDSEVFAYESYTYNVGNQRTTIERDSTATSVNYGYDKIGQLTKASGTDWALNEPRRHEQFGYGYDAAGNLNLRTNNALVETFNVNSLNELTTATRTGTFTVAGTTTSEATDVTVNSAAATLYADRTFASTNHTLANGNNTFTAVANDSYGRTSSDAITAYLPATNIFLYDSNGNLTNDGNRSFAYDDENQLISVWVSNKWKSDFQYDGKMRRRVRFESTWNGSIWITNEVVRYIYDGNLVLQERNTNNVPLVTYTRGKDLSGSFEGAGCIGGLFARTENASLMIGDVGANAFYHSDGNGNITCLISFSKVIVAKYLYDPFGGMLSQSGSLASQNLYRFSSKEFHLPSGLISYLYRYYEPNLQRWLNRDPVYELGFTMISSQLPAMDWRLLYNMYLDIFNQYGFVNNDGIDCVDTDGRTFWSKTKQKVLGPVAHFVGNNWGKLGILGMACIIPNIYDCYKQLTGALDAVAAYNSVAARLNDKYGDPSSWPPDVSNLMTSWKIDVLRQMSQASKACAGIGGTMSSGPVDNPIRM